jgi:hypothetical protein
MPIPQEIPVTHTSTSILALRLADRGDAVLLRRLADLDDAAPLDAPVLLAFEDGEPVAAASLSDGRAVADPFRPTADAVALLELRARQLRGPQTVDGWRRRRRAAQRPWGVPRLRVA